MMRRTAKSMAVCVMAFLLLCGCSHKSKESVNTQQDFAEEYFGTGSSSNVDDSSGGNGSFGGYVNATSGTAAGSPGSTAGGNAAGSATGGDAAVSATGGGAAGSATGGDAAVSATGGDAAVSNGNAAGGANSEPGAADDAAVKIFVYVCGAVNEPGVYVLSEGSRVYEAIRMAGGMTPEANEAFVNQARELVDGEQITVYTKEETEGLDPEKYADDSPEGAVTGSKGKVNINTATAEELTSLSGIGEARAEAIIEYRETNGAFRETADIMKISGIGEALYNKIKDDIVVS